MPDNKQYFVQVPGASKGQYIDSETYNQRRDQFFKEFPDAQVVEVGEYTPGKSEIDNNSQYEVYVDGMSKPQYIGGDQFAAKADEFFKQYPNAKVRSIRPDNYYGDRLTEIYEEMASLQEELKGEVIPGRDENGNYTETRVSLGSGTNEVQGDPRAIQGSSLNEMQNIMRERREEPERKKKEAAERRLEELRAERDNNPAWQKFWEQTNSSIDEDLARVEEMQAEAKKRVKDGDTQSLMDPEILEATKNMLLEAKKVASAPSKYDNEGGALGQYLADYGKGIVDTGFDALSFVNTAKKLKNVNLIEALQQIQRNEGDDANVSDLIRNHKDEIPYLSNEQKELVQAFVKNAEIQQSRSDNISNAYKAGQGFAQSLGFMADFLMAGKVFGEKGLATAGPLVEKTAKGSLGRLGAETVEGAVKALVMTPLMPSTYSNVLDSILQLDENGGVDLSGKAVLKAIGDAAIENISETVGSKPLELLGWGIGKLPVGEAIGKTKFGQVAKAMRHSPIFNSMKQAGWNGLVEEMFEEVTGNYLRYVTGIDKKALSEFFKPDEFFTTLASFAPMSLLGGLPSTASFIRSSNKMTASQDVVKNMLSEAGVSEDQIKFIISSMQDAESPEAVGEILSTTYDLAVKNGVEPAKAIAAIQGYAKNASEYKVLEGVYEEQKDVERTRTALDLDVKLGTPNWRHEGQNGEQFVRTFTDENGNVFYMQNEDEGGAYSAIGEDGKLKFIYTPEIQDGKYMDSGEIPMNSFLDGEVRDQKAAREQVRMQQETESAQAQLAREAYIGRDDIEVGTPEASVKGVITQFVGGKYVVQGEDGSIHTYSPQEMANKLNVNLTPKTDEQITTEEVAAMEKADQSRVAVNAVAGRISLDGFRVGIPNGSVAERIIKKDDGSLMLIYRDQRGNRKITDLSEGELDALAEMAKELPEVEENIETPAERKAEEIDLQQYIGDDGEMDEDALWTDHPAEWAKWNDAQRQDGGANSKQYIQGAIGRLEAEIAAAQTAYANEPNFKNRKAIEQALEEKGNRLNTLLGVLNAYETREPAAEAQAKKQEEKPKEKSIRTITDSLRDIQTRKGRADGDLREAANQLPDKWHEYLTLANRETGEKRDVAIAELVRLSEQYRGNAAADAVLEAYNAQKTPEQIAAEKEEQRRKPLRARAQEWVEKTGVPVELLESIDDVKAKDAREAIEGGKLVKGWYVNGKVYIYLPNNEDEADIDKTYIHEVVSHKGLSEMLGKSWHRFLDRVWDDVMTEETRKKFTDYVKQTDQNASGVDLQRKAADEFIADLSEKIGLESVTEEELTAWNKFVRILQSYLMKLFSGGTKVTEEDLSTLLRESLARFYYLNQNGSATPLMRQMGEFAEEVNKPTGQESATLGSEIRFSITQAPRLRDDSKAFYDKLAAKPLTEEELKVGSDAIDAMADYMRPYLDKVKDGKRFMPEEVFGKGWSTIFENGSYGKTMENTLICMRTLAYNDFVNAVQEKIGRPLTPTESFLASQMLYDIATDPQCLYCYVALDRKAYNGFLKLYIEQRDAVLDKYKADDSIDRSYRLPAQARSKKDRKRIEGDNPVNKLYLEYLNGREDSPAMRKRFNGWLDDVADGTLIKMSDLTSPEKRQKVSLQGDSYARQIDDAERYAQSASWAKKQEEYRAYNGELLKMPQRVVDMLNKEYGLRFYSFSEYTPAFIVENMQMIRDAALRNLVGLAYTKEVDFAKIFAPTGVNINISTYGREAEDGTVVMDTKQGADWAEAMALREQYGNVGVVFVATNDKMVEWAINQPWIDCVIPFHIVRTGENIAAFYDWTNYTAMEGEKDTTGHTKYIVPTEHKNDKDTFLALCEERGLKPRFADLILPSTGRSVVESPNYMKLVNETRRSVEETERIKPVFNTDAARESFDNFVEKGGYYGGWFVEDGAFEKGVDQVASDVLAGKTAKDVDYGRQDIKASAEKLAEMAMKRTRPRTHQAKPLTKVEKKKGDKALAQIIESIDKKAKAEEYDETAPMRFKKGDPSTQIGNTYFRLGNGTLVGMHNISEDKLRKADKAGGLANPSAAVIDITKQEHNNFGEISLVMPSSMVAATSGKNNGTYLGDAWTPTFPGTQKKMSKVGQKAFDKQIMALPSDVRYNVENAFENYLEEDRDGNALRWWFLNETGRDPAIIHHESPYSTEDAKVIENLNEWELKDEDIRTLGDIYRKYASEEDVRKATTKFEPREEAKESVRKWMQEYNDEIDKYGINLGSVERFLRQAKDQIHRAGRLDDYRTMDSARQFIEDNNLGEEFRSWLEGKEEEFGVETKLFAGWDRNGYKKWIDYTAENASKLMNKESGRNAYSDNGLSATHALLVRKMRTLADIKKNKDLLVSRAEYDERYDQVDKELHDAISTLDGMQKISDNPFTNYDYTASRLQEALTRENPAAYLNNEYKYSIPEDGEYAQQLQSLKRDIMEMPVNYFETKFNRPVGLNEFTSAVVPSNLDEKTRKILEDAGVKMFEYDPKQEGSRRDATMKATEPEGIRFRVANENQRIFVSNAEKAVEEMKMDKATPEQWKKTLEKNGGLKAAEDKWLGLSTWLDGLDKKTVTKQEVLDFIAENQIQIEETRYADDAAIEREDAAALRSYQDELDAYAKQHNGDYDAAYEDLVDQHRYGFRNAFDLNGGQVLEPKVDWNGELSDAAKYFLDQRRGGTDKRINTTRLHYTTEGLENRHEIALTVPTIEAWNESDQIHFGDAGEGRAISWARFGDTWTSKAKDEAEKKYREADKAFRDYRNEIVNKYALQATDTKKTKDLATDEENAKVKELQLEADRLYKEWKYGQHPREKVLVIDEIQSKRHQEGREKGYQGDPRFNEELEATRQKRIEASRALDAKVQELADKYNNGNFRETWNETVYHVRSLVKDSTREKNLKKAAEKYGAEEIDTIKSLTEQDNALADEIRKKIDAKESAIPAAPFEKNWPELTMKRMLRYAAEFGYDTVAWTTGEQQAERYNIGETVNSIERNSDERFTIFTKGNGYFEIDVDEDGIVSVVSDSEYDDFDGKPLSDVVGKEMAVRMMSMDEGASLSGEDLRIGGEGMKGFYDDILVRFMNKYGKKWGVKVEDINLPNVGADAAAGIAKGLTMHSVKVTPEMKESVMQGQTMFRITPEQDKEYLDAVESGDMEKAGKMVETAAREAGYDSPKLYHGSDAFGFTRIDTSMSDDRASFWATNKENVAGSYTKLSVTRKPGSEISDEEYEKAVEVADNALDEEIQNFRSLIDKYFSEWYFGQQGNEGIRNVIMDADHVQGYGDGVYDVLEELVLEAYEGYGSDFNDEYEDFADWEENSPEAQEIFDSMSSLEGLRNQLWEIENGDLTGGIYELYANTDNMFVVDAGGKAWNELHPEGLPKIERGQYKDVPYRTRDVVKWAKENGYDGVLFKNIKDNGQYGRTEPSDVYAFLNPQAQVKSADPVTYDDNGNVIPLSERFNEGNEDIRFSIREDNLERIDNAIANSAPPVDRETAESIVSAMESEAEKDPTIPFSEEEWDKQFVNDRVQTPIGEIKLGENQKTKLDVKNRRSQFGMMKPTLEDPDLILYKEDKNPPEDAERAGKLLFVKTFVNPDGDKHINFESVTVRRENLEISISSHIAERSAIVGELQEDRVVYMREALLSDSSERYLAEQNGSVPDLVPTQESNASSEDKDSDNSEIHNTFFRIVEDPAKIEELEADMDDKPAYRAAQFVPDPNGDWEFDLGDGNGLQKGFLYPPMSAQTEKGEWREPIRRDQWEQSEEAPEKAILKKGKKGDTWVFRLHKGNGKYVDAAYNPYFHSSETMLNDQFAEAQSRPNLVVMEVMLPQSQIDENNPNPYHAEKAKDHVGKHDWKAGPIQQQLTGTRKVNLTQYDKPVRIVPVDEVATNVERMIRGQVKEMPTNVVTPQLRAALERLGVPFVETSNQGVILEGEHKGENYQTLYKKGKKKLTPAQKKALAFVTGKKTDEENIAEANTLQKQPVSEQVAEQVVDMMEPAILFRLSNNNRATVESWLKKREDLTDEQRASVIDYIDDLDDAKLQLATARWFANKSIRIPEDMDKVKQAVSVAGKAKVDPLQYDNPMSLLEAHANFKPTAERINPDNVPTLHRADEYPADGVVVYDVDEGEESRKNMRQIINTHFGEDASPWCLLQGDGKGNLTKESKKYWNHYNSYPKQVAFKDGKLLAFSANDSGTKVWWDRQDTSHYGIPITKKIEGDELGRSAVHVLQYEAVMKKDALERDLAHKYNCPPYRLRELASPEEIAMLDEVNREIAAQKEAGTMTFQMEGGAHPFRGNRQNGVYEEWSSDGNILLERAEYKDGKANGISETWYPNGQQEERVTMVDDHHVGPAIFWFDNGQVRFQGNFDEDSKKDGKHESWYKNGNKRYEVNYDHGQLVGERREWDEDGTLMTVDKYDDNGDWLSHEDYGPHGIERRVSYPNDHDRVEERFWRGGRIARIERMRDGKLEGTQEYYYADGTIQERENYHNGERDGIREKFHPNGQLFTRGEYKAGKKVGVHESWSRDGVLNTRTEFKDDEVVDGSPMDYLRFRITPEQDQEYMDAVNAGDMEKADRMVREAAAAAMPDTVVVDSDGLPKKVLHGTNAEFNTFDEKMIGSANDPGWLGRGFYFFGNAPEYAAQYGKRVISAYLNITDPYYASNEDMRVLAALESEEASGSFREDVEADGYDGVNYNGDLNDEWVAFYPNQIKSADPVTYDDNGDVIPLSERFNDESNDIRFSIRGIIGAENAEDQAALDNLEVAEEMEKEGKDMPTIWQATGWEKGADGKWRNEIPDAKQKEGTDLKPTNRAGDILDAPELFKSYPQLEDIEIELKNLPGSTVGVYMPKENKIVADINNNTELEKGKQRFNSEGIRTILHELQHAIQYIEGFAKGGTEKSLELDRYKEVLKDDPALAMLAFTVFSRGRNSAAKVLRAGRSVVLNQAESLDISMWADSDKKAFATLIEKLKGMDESEFQSFAKKAAKMAKEAKKYGDSGYKKLAGEVEARNVERRSHLNDELRGKITLRGSEDVTREEQIVRFRIDENPVSYDESLDGKEEAVKKTAESCGVEVEFKPASEMNFNGKPLAGRWVDGKMYVCPENCRDTEDATKTVLHEAVGHNGLRKLIGNENMTAFCLDVFGRLPKSVREEISDNAMRKYGLNIAEATEEYLAKKAEDVDFENQEERTFWQTVRDALREALGKIGINIPLNEYDVRWLMWQSYNANKQSDIFNEAKRQVVARKLGFTLRQQADKGEAVQVARNREATNAEVSTSARAYNFAARNVWKRLKETFVDQFTAVNDLISAIEKSSGKEAKDYEDVRLALNQQGSKALAKMNDWIQRFNIPMWDAIKEVMKASNTKLSDVERYVMLKHGLERNEVFAKRDARAYYKNIYDKAVEKINDDESLTLEDKEYMLGKEKQRYEKHLEKIDKGTDTKYKELREQDYGGLTGLYSEFDDIEPQGKMETNEEFAARQKAARHPKYDSVADMEAAAAKEVAEFEKKAQGTTDNLWEKINAATGETLKQQYESNIISRDQYNHVKGMFKYYVPLRGFTDIEAEDLFDYYNSDQRQVFTAPLQRAKGRTTQAESPFGFIAAAESSGVAQDMKNETKLALYYFVSNRPGNNLVTVSETWYEKVGEDEDGKAIFEPVYPEFGESLSTEEAKKNYEDWERGMKEKAKAGLAFKGKGKLDLSKMVVHINPQHESEHVIPFKLGGKDMFMYINGNPRAAQAINGELNYNAEQGVLTETLNQVLRSMSALNTQLNPEFWISNFQRDALFAIMSTSVKEDGKYAKAFRNNLIKAGKVVKMKKAYENGKLGDSEDERLYKEFVENGGVTGYTVVYDNEYWEKRLDEYAGKDKKIVAKVLDSLKGFSEFGEAIEQMTRFAAYKTSRQSGKDIIDSVNDAKELTVNFNRKGSGKPISLEEAKNLKWNNGKPLDKLSQYLVSFISNLSPYGRRFIMFFNASIQGLNAMVKLFKANPKKTAAWVGGYLMMGALNAALHAMGDDDDDYLDIPDYERRNNLMLGAKGVFFKWALPQEARVFYGIGDMIVNHALGREPHKSMVGEILSSLGEVAPIDFTSGVNGPSEMTLAGLADPLIPSAARPLWEIWQNKNFMGSRVYNEHKYYSEEERSNIPAYRDPLPNTSGVYIALTKALNYLSGGDDYSAGFVNWNPNKLEHFVEGYTGGAGTSIEKLAQFFENTANGQFAVRDTPFLRKVLSLNDERYRNSHTTDLYYYYQDRAAETTREIKEATKNGDDKKLDKLFGSKQYEEMLIFEQYKGILKYYNEQLKVTDDENEKRTLMREQDALRKEMIQQISEIGKDND